MSDTITVTVLDRKAWDATWGHGCPSIHSFLRTLTLPRFTEQGERRSDPTQQRSCEDGEFYSVSRWTLDSGRVETYEEVLTRAALEAIAEELREGREAA